MITVSVLCMIASCVCFFLGGFAVPLGRANWLCFGFAFWTLAILLGGAHAVLLG